MFVPIVKEDFSLPPAQARDKLINDTFHEFFVHYGCEVDTIAHNTIKIYGADISTNETKTMFRMMVEACLGRHWKYKINQVGNGIVVNYRYARIV